MDKIIKPFYDQFNRYRTQRTGTIKHDGQKLMPNQKCPCGSGKKYKKCCQNSLEQAARTKGTNNVTMRDIKAITRA